MRLSTLTSKESTLVFRALLTAFAFPGRVSQLPRELVARMPALCLPMLALTDIETTMCAPDQPELQAEIATITGARTVASRDAQFVMHDAMPTDETTLNLHRGTTYQPELGCRLVLAWNVPTVTAVPALPDSTQLRLSGPGVVSGTTLTVNSASAAFLTARSVANSRPPMGIDCWLVSATGEVIGLPRTTHIAAMSFAGSVPGKN